MPFKPILVSLLLQVSNRTLEVLSSCQEAEAQRLSKELKDMQQYLEDVNDEQSVQFLNVLRGFLDHKVPKEVDSLSGMYSRAADRILNQVCMSITIAQMAFCTHALHSLKLTKYCSPILEK